MNLIRFSGELHEGVEDVVSHRRARINRLIQRPKSGNKILFILNKNNQLKKRKGDLSSIFTNRPMLSQ
jgi:hypothetical protein